MNLTSLKLGRTKGLSPKVPYQAVAAVITFLAATVGLHLDSELAFALSTAIGALAGFQAPAGDREVIAVEATPAA